ncbi:tetratricopeptide repeat protein [Rhodovulum adriaticum]|uniref:Tfp pilus assembly protein PilF n=1 Tax=Rhodovulum adriaticum TaxID=35804 RepID=A0A4R2NTI5_RHOAD|nr:tetratricopeptide repeat protein [Rhodovulum adriaticum]MBK1635018.1 hypothetical protein [Rhodovulum adriaticum]TCP25349.1 Tfp pilus assembly protein PilF [Rhodovulum adriaticum]
MSDTNEWTPSFREFDDTDTQSMGYIRSLFSEGRVEEARAELQKQIEADPDNARPVIALGFSLLRERRLEEAARQFEKAMDLDPENEVPALLAAQVGMRGDNPEYAEVNFHKALAANPNSVRALTGLSRLHLRNDKPEEAITVLERAIEADPQSRRLRQRLAALCVDQDRYEDAQAHLEHVLSIFPDDIPTVIQLGNALHDMGKADEALTLLRRTAEAHPEDAGLLSALGNMLIRSGNFQEAEGLLRRAVTLPRRAAAAGGEQASQLGQGQAQSPRQAEFRRRMADWFRGRPRVFAQLLLVQALIPQNKQSEAREILAQLPRRGNMAVAIQRLYGDAFAREGNITAAEESYRAALHSAPKGETYIRKIDEARSARKLSDTELFALYTDALDQSQKDMMSSLFRMGDRD